MIDAEFDFHNENDYSESDREMKDENTDVYEDAADIQRIDKVL